MLLRCDRSVDRSQTDTIYIILKIVSLKRIVKQYFLGVGQVKQGDSERILDAIEITCINTVGRVGREFMMLLNIFLKMYHRDCY